MFSGFASAQGAHWRGIKWGIDEMITDQEVKEQTILFWKWGVAGLLLVELLLYIIFFSINIRYYQDTSYNVIGTLVNTFFLAFPHMACGILFYAVGFAVRGAERKSVALNLSRMDEMQKWIALGIIKKSMINGPKIIPEKPDKVPDEFYPGGKQ